MASIPPSNRSNSDSFRSNNSTASVISTAASTVSTATTASSRPSTSNMSIASNSNSNSNPNSTPTPKRSSNLPNLSTPSARSSIASSTGINPTPRTVGCRTKTISTSSATSSSKPYQSSNARPPSRFNSIPSIFPGKSANSNVNPFTPDGRKLMGTTPANSATANRMRLANEKVAAASKTNPIRNSPSKSQLNSKPSLPKATSSMTIKSKGLAGRVGESWTDNEPIKAFLRIRPPPSDGRDKQMDQHLEVVSETEVLMRPNDSYRRVGEQTNPTNYSFTKVFSSTDPESSKPQAEDSNSQSSFFKDTTLPMVKDLLDGRSGLVFTYGVTNGGKSYTIQGERGDGREGILPRALDTVFNSIEGFESESDIRPAGWIGVERIPPEESPIEESNAAPSLSIQGLLGRFTSSASSSKIFPHKSRQASNSAQIPHVKDPTTVQVDRNRRYSVWVSYVELYHEKWFDLLDMNSETPSNNWNGSGMTRSATFSWSLSGRNGGASDGSNAYTLCRKPLPWAMDPETRENYVGGVKEFRVRSSAEAQELLRRGQENKAVFGTMANRASSRSHGIFTIKIITEHNANSMLNPDESIGLSCSTSRLTIIDLAGSERAASTGSSLERAAEAKKINLSLYTLGCCMKILRENQALALNAIMNSSGERKKRSAPTMVPFKESQLTRMIRPFLTGDEAGKAVMIVNVNPWDTGFDENSKVLQFSAVTQEIKTTAASAKSQHLPSPSKKDIASVNSVFKNSRGAGKKIGEVKKSSGVVKDKQVQTERGISGLDESKEVEISILEISDSEEEDEDEGGSKAFIGYLLEQHEELRTQLLHAEMRCAMIETQVRDEMADEMDVQLQKMERLYNERALNDAEQHEVLANRKLDLLSNFNQSEQTPRAASSNQFVDAVDGEDENEDEDEDEEDDHEDDHENDHEDDHENDHEEEVEQDLLGLPSSPMRMSDLVINRPSHLTSPSELIGKRHPLASSSSDSPSDSSGAILRPGRAAASKTSSALELARQSIEGEDAEEEDEEEEDSRDGSEEDDEESEESSQDVSHSQSQESSQISESEASEDEESQEEADEEEEKTESSEAPLEETSTSAFLPTRASTRSTRGLTRANPSSSSIVDEGETTRSRSTRKAAAVANAKVSSSKSGKEVEKKGRKVGAANALKERIQVEDEPSDTSLIAKPTKERKKRVLRSKKAVDEESMLDLIPDTSLVAAVKRSNTSNRIASNSGRLR